MAADKTVTLENVTPAQLILRYLALEGTTTLFGIPGAAVVPLLDALRLQSDTFNYVICRQETGAAYMADGYARAGGHLGVVLVTSGPGATNALTGTMNADACGSALMTITGEVKEAYFGLGYLQEGADATLDVNGVYRSAIGFTTFIDNPANFRVLFETALRESLTEPAAAVHVGIPVDVQGGQIPTIEFPSAPSNYRAMPHGNDPAGVEQALELLLAAQRPLIFLGNGARAALQDTTRAAAFQTFVDSFAIPVMTTPEAKGIFPEGDALSLRNYGLAGSAWTEAYLTGAPPYDALLVLGSALGELAATWEIAPPPTNPTYWSQTLVPAGPFIQIDIDHTAIGRAFPVDLGIVADAGPALDTLLSAAQGRTPPSAAADRAAYVAQLKQQPVAPPIPAPTPGTVHPGALMNVLNEAIPPGSHVFVDSGNCVGWSNAYLEINPPTQLHSALSMGPMGFAVCAVVGAKLAAPNATCIAICGDGALLMQGSEISTAAVQEAGAIWIVLDDGDLAMVSQGMAEFVPGLNWQRYYSLGNTDIVGYATALGAQAALVTDASQLPTVFATALTGAGNGVPQVIAVKVDPTAVPPYYVPK